MYLMRILNNTNSFLLVPSNINKYHFIDDYNEYLSKTLTNIVSPNVETINRITNNTIKRLIQHFQKLENRLAPDLKHFQTLDKTQQTTTNLIYNTTFSQGKIQYYYIQQTSHTDETINQLLKLPKLNIISYLPYAYDPDVKENLDWKHLNNLIKILKTYLNAGKSQHDQNVVFNRILTCLLNDHTIEYFLPKFLKNNQKYQQVQFIQPDLNEDCFIYTNLGINNHKPIISISKDTNR